MDSVTIYISEHKDPDLAGLVKQIGIKNFRKLAKCSLLALNNPEYIGKSKEYMMPGNDAPAKEGCFRVIISLRDQRLDDLKLILSQIKTRQLSNFVKQVIRFYVSPMDLLPFYFNKDVKFSQQMYTPLVINSVLSSTKHTKRRKKSSRTTYPVTPAQQMQPYPYGMPPGYYAYPAGQPPVVTPEQIPPVTTPVPEKEPVKAEKETAFENEPFLDFSAPTQTPETPDDKQDEVLAMLSNLLG